MKLQVPEFVIKPLDMCKYASQWDYVLDVWANPPDAVIVAWDEIKFELNNTKEVAARKLFGSDPTREGLTKLLLEAKADEDPRYQEWLAVVEPLIEEARIKKLEWASELWSKGPDEEKHQSVEDLDEFLKASEETDPSIFAWMVSQSLLIISDHRLAVKKVLAPQSR